MKHAIAPVAGKARQRQNLFACVINLIQQMTELRERFSHSAGKGPLQPFAQCIQILLAVEDKVTHPSVARLEHPHQQRLHLLPVVVAPQQQRFNRLAQRCRSLVQLFQGAARGAAQQHVGLTVNFKHAAKAGDQRLLQRQLAAEGIDGGDAQLRGLVEKIPAELNGALKSAVGQRCG